MFLHSTTDKIKNYQMTSGNTIQLKGARFIIVSLRIL